MMIAATEAGGRRSAANPEVGSPWSQRAISAGLGLTKAPKTMERVLAAVLRKTQMIHSWHIRSAMPFRNALLEQETGASDDVDIGERFLAQVMSAARVADVGYIRRFTRGVPK
jgi:hypothetical protein